MTPDVSVVMTTYAGDDPPALKACFDSLRAQTRSPEEVVIVRDHDLPAPLTSVIAAFRAKATFPVHDITITDRGLGHARSVGVENATSELVAIIDADDIAPPTRLERQLDFFDRNPAVDVVGGYSAEFDGSPDNVWAVREVPTDPKAIERTAHVRCPLNHPTAMFRRDAVLEAGNYRPLEYGADYELWCRLLANGKVLANIPEILVKARTTDLVSRRQGLEIARRELQLQRAIVATGFYGWEWGVTNLLIRIPLRLLPKRLVKNVYRRFLRTRPSAR